MSVTPQQTQEEKEYVGGLVDRGIFDDKEATISTMENGAVEWSQACWKYIETLDEDVRDIATYWLLEACPKYAEYLTTKIILPNGNVITSSTNTDGDDDRCILQIRKPNELFRAFNSLISTFRSSDTDRYANQDDLTLIGSALSSATYYDLLEKPVEYVQRYIQHLESMQLQREPVLIGNLLTLKRALAVTVKPAYLDYETPTSIDFSLLPTGYERSIELWNDVARKISFFPSLLNAEELAVSFMLHKIRCGIAQEEINGQLQSVAFVYAMQKENKFYTEDASRNPEKLLAKSKEISLGLRERWVEKISDLMAFAEKYPAIVTDVLGEDFFPSIEGSLEKESIPSVRSYLLTHPDLAFHDYEGMNPRTSSYLRVPGRVEVVNLVKALKNCEEAIETMPALQEELSRLTEAYRNNDKMLYELDQGLPKVTEEERAFKSSKAKAQAGVTVDQIYDPESPRMVPRAGFAALVCGISAFHASGIREIRIPTFMPFRWIGHMAGGEENAAVRIHYATTNVLIRMAVRAAEQIKGAHITSLGEGDQMLKIHLDEDLSSDNAIIQDVINATKTLAI